MKLDESQGLDRTIDAAQLAAILGVSARSVHQMVRRGKGPKSVKIGNLTRFSVGAVNKWLAGEE